MPSTPPAIGSYGGGFFDRTLAALAPRPMTIGVGFDFSVPSIFPQAHDQPLDAMVTESGCDRAAGPQPCKLRQMTISPKRPHAARHFDKTL